MSRPVITLTTDFGQVDGYVASMKGVILSICPQAELVDISHEVRPQAVPQAAYLLSFAAPYFPAGTVHLVVVDPEVGGRRRAIAVQGERAQYVAPDNGVLSLALAQDPARAAVELVEPRFRLPEVSATFHGRDIFAPAAAHLACGVTMQEMGPSLQASDLASLPVSRPVAGAPGEWLAEVLHVDRFGNLVTNFVAASTATSLTILAGGERIWGLRRTFGDVDPGQLVAYVGSGGYVEIAVREGSAAERLGLGTGDPVRITEDGP
jgi:S-adenosylmethionine hydrolase